jgi:hypothetical protein
MNVAAVEPVAPARDEQVGGDRVTEELCAPLEVVGQDRAGGRMDRHEPPLAELGTAYRQDRLFKIHVGELEVQRFRQAHARHAEQAEQAVEDPGPQRRRRPGNRQLQRRIEQPPDLALGVWVRPGARRVVRQQAERWNLGSAVGGTAMAGEAAHEAKPPSPLCGLHRRALSPLECQPGVDVLGAVRFHEADEARQQQPFAVHLVAQTLPQFDVFLQGLAQRVHRAPPGQAMTRVRSAARSTLA